MWHPGTRSEDIQRALGKKRKIDGEYFIWVKGEKIFVLVRNGCIHCCGSDKETILATREEAYDWRPPEEEKKPCPQCGKMINNKGVNRTESGNTCYYCGVELATRHNWQFITREEAHESWAKLKKESEEAYERNNAHLKEFYDEIDRIP
jgi:hypothetical protein